MLDVSQDGRDETTHRHFLDKAWHAFVADGVELDGLDAEILRSWRRARDTFGIDPAQRRCRRLLTPAELEARRGLDDAHRLALPVLREFGERLAPLKHVLAYFDPAGWMLSVDGDPRVAERVAEINFCPGANWSEASVGTNGPGTALAERRPVKVFATEHYVEAWQSWTCSAAPILDPDTGVALGLIDITGPWQSHQVHALVAARAIAQAIQERLRSARLLRDQVVEYAFRAAEGGDEGLIAVDHRGRALAANDAVRRRLAFEGLDLPSPLLSALESALMPPGRSDRELSVVFPKAGTVRLQARPVRFDGELVGAVVRVAPAAVPRAAARLASPRVVAGATRYDFDKILGRSEAVGAALKLAHVAASNELPVVLFGESGTGKELFAQAIHAASARASGPFVAVNCGCIPASLVESELFGYEPGTFTGGRKEGKAGKFEEAGQGTLFLDEVNELPAQAQTALLRVLQEREVVRLGSSSPRRVDIRVIAASNRSLPEEIRAGRFRSDLYFRLNVLAISIPPLKDRVADVAPLAGTFLAEAAEQLARPGLELSTSAIRLLEAYAWPGNVRELRNVVLRAAATAKGLVIQPADLPAELRAGEPAPPPVAEARDAARAQPAFEPPSAGAEREELVQALKGTSWNIARTASLLRVSRMTLYRRLRRLGIVRC
jgi:sigma-54 dependent transcriptional regulator, acetoin dehydrogenase operon transcriptional activator AcoR